MPIFPEPLPHTPETTCKPAGQANVLEAAPGGGRIAVCTAAGALEIWQGETQPAVFEMQAQLQGFCGPEAACCAWLPGLKLQLLVADSAG